MEDTNIGIVGYGEVGKIFAQGLQGNPGVASISAWDLTFADPALSARERAQCAPGRRRVYPRLDAALKAKGR